ncbi:MAG: GNAT family N-acetyltransferase [Cyanophyceae cyanobacterium]
MANPTPSEAKSFDLPLTESISVRPWQPGDRQAAADLIRLVLGEYNLPWQPESADRDVVQVEECYLQADGEFWVLVQRQGSEEEEELETLVGTAAYFPVARGDGAVEIRKMYFHPSIRGLGLGRKVLTLLEEVIAQKGFKTIWIETVSAMKAAIHLYETSGYQPDTDVETERCDRCYVKYLS